MKDIYALITLYFSLFLISNLQYYYANIRVDGFSAI